MMYSIGFGMGWWMLVGWLIMAAIVVFALYGLIVLLKKSDPNFAVGSHNVALDIIKERLARGEIEMDEYHRLREELLK